MPPLPHQSSLSPRQQTFCREYLLENNATRAAIKAGYSPDTARQQGSRLLTNVNIQARIMENQAEIADHYCAKTAAFMTKLEALHQRAFDRGDYHAAVRAIEAQLRLAGLCGETSKTRKIPENSDKPLTGACAGSNS